MINPDQRDQVKDPSIVQESTTTFVDDAKVVTSAIEKPVPMSMELLKSVDSVSDKSLISFLEKPIIVDSGILASTDTATTFSSYPIYETMLAKTLYSNKLDGFLGMRADVELTLVVNAQRFQQGRYVILCSYLWVRSARWRRQTIALENNA
jgi:hypothetical protein